MLFPFIVRSSAALWVGSCGRQISTRQRSLHRSVAEPSRFTRHRCVPPFGHKTHLRVFIDPDLLQYEEVWTVAGTWHDVFGIEPPGWSAGDIGFCPLVTMDDCPLRPIRPLLVIETARFASAHTGTSGTLHQRAGSVRICGRIKRSGRRRGS